MSSIKLYLVLFVELFRLSDCKRRIQGGDFVTSYKPYMAYLIMAPMSEKNYDSWLCGGALVSTEFIITSAACVTDVDYMYAVAGYNKNVPDSEIELNDCTKNKKKKVVYRCYPKKYELKYDELDYWAYIDIALVKVESPFHPNDISYQVACTYIPQPIVINYDKKFQEAGIDAFVLGWGHQEIWRTEADLDSYNTVHLKYAPVLVEEKELCIKEYADYPNMTDVINEYMICASGEGNLDEYGKLIDKAQATADGCAMQQAAQGSMNASCEEEPKTIDNTRRDTQMKFKQTNNASSIDIMDDLIGPDNDNITASNRTIRNYRRKENGICQNDHGGPIVTWKGGREVLIGVSSVFKVSTESKCIGPYLFTSTFCTSKFVDCVIRSDKKKRKYKGKRSVHTSDDMDAICDAPASVRGFETIESHISWRQHPAGPAENEMVGEHIARYKIDEGVHDRFAIYKQKVHTETYEEIAKQKYLEVQRKAIMKRKAAVEMKEAEKKKSAVNEKYAQTPTYEANENYGRNPYNEANKNYPRNPYNEANKNYPRNPYNEANKQYAPIPRYEANEKYSQTANYDPNKSYARDPSYEANKQYAPTPMYKKNKAFGTIEQGNDGLVMRPIRPIRS